MDMLLSWDGRSYKMLFLGIAQRLPLQLSRVDVKTISREWILIVSFAIKEFLALYIKSEFFYVVFILFQNSIKITFSLQNITSRYIKKFSIGCNDVA